MGLNLLTAKKLNLIPKENQKTTTKLPILLFIKTKKVKREKILCRIFYALNTWIDKTYLARKKLSKDRLSTIT